jgi:hypothetical protein
MPKADWILAINVSASHHTGAHFHFPLVYKIETPSEKLEDEILKSTQDAIRTAFSGMRNVGCLMAREDQEPYFGGGATGSHH